MVAPSALIRILSVSVFTMNFMDIVYNDLQYTLGSINVYL